MNHTNHHDQTITITSSRQTALSGKTALRDTVTIPPHLRQPVFPKIETSQRPKGRLY